MSAAATDEHFIVDLGDFEGPLDLLLDLARSQKVDLKRISVLLLAEQYLHYLEEARARKLEIAAEYLVMAAWLAYLKSQLLLPPPERDEEDAEKLAEALTDRLRTREAIRKAVAWLEARPLLGRERLVRGLVEEMPVDVRPRWKGTLPELLSAYGRMMRSQERTVVRMPQRRLFSVEMALERLSRLLTGHEWRDLVGFLPEGLRHDVERRAAVVASLLATLELARTGVIELQQAAPFGPIKIRRRTSREAADERA
jgi:segregation and condensation protein A